MYPFLCDFFSDPKYFGPSRYVCNSDSVHQVEHGQGAILICETKRFWTRDGIICSHYDFRRWNDFCFSICLSACVVCWGDERRHLVLLVSWIECWIWKIKEKWFSFRLKPIVLQGTQSLAPDSFHNFRWRR